LAVIIPAALRLHKTLPYLPQISFENVIQKKYITLAKAAVRHGRP